MDSFYQSPMSLISFELPVEANTHCYDYLDQTVQAMLKTSLEALYKTSNN